MSQALDLAQIITLVECAWCLLGSRFHEAGPPAGPQGTHEERTPHVHSTWCDHGWMTRSVTPLGFASER